MFYLMSVSGAWAELLTTASDQHAVSITIYNDDLALVRDSRKVDFLKGEQILAFKEVSSSILPETALLKADSIDVVEQNFEFDLLTPESLLNKYVGRQVTLVKTNYKTGKEEHFPAKVLSTTNGVVLKVGRHIETFIDGHLIYPDVPENLRDKPTLSMVLDSSKKGPRNVELVYLTRSLSWKTDYVAELNKKENRLDIKGWVTLTNRSGASYKDAKLQLVAGDVNRAREEYVIATESVMATGRAAKAKPQKVSRESMFEYHLYTINRPTTIKDNQSKQIALLHEDNGICNKHLVFKSGRTGSYLRKTREIIRKKSVSVFLEFKNDKASNFGKPKPAGVVRVYKKDSAGFSQFVGEDRISHTPENEMVRIKLGNAFDVTADRVQTDFYHEKRAIIGTRVYESEYEITLKNAKEQSVDVKVIENIPGNWKIKEESLKHTKETSASVSWVVPVPSKGSTTLKYRVKTEL